MPRLLSYLNLTIVALSLLWVAGVHRQMGLLLFTEQPLAALLGLTVAAGWLSLSHTSERWHRLIPLTGLALGILTLLFFAWLALNYQRATLLAMMRDPWLAWTCLALLLVLLLQIWRLVGLTIALVLIVFVVITRAGSWFGLPSTPFDRIALYLVTDPGGLLGLPLRVALEIVIPFIFFGRLLHSSGGSAWFTDIASAAFGRYRGGAAKAAVGASALFGSVSGNAVSNVVGTGIITIPMMVKTGFRPQIAAAVEAVASTGGQLLPPVMGTAAFVMADMLSRPYTEILAAALLPALLYFAAVFIQVDRVAIRDGIHGLAQSEMVSSWQVFLAGCHFLLPFVALFIAFIYFSAGPQTAALVAITVLLMVGTLRRYQGQRLTFSGLITAASHAGSSAGPVILVTAAAGLLIGLINLSGVSFSLAQDVISLSGGSTIWLLVLAALAAIVLGMGMPTVAVYVLLATLLAPALIQGNVGELQAHLFILYFGMLSMITPPIALAAIAAANIAETKPWPTSLAALQLAWVAYLVPFLLVFSPSLIMQGSWGQITLTALSALAGIYAVTIALVGYTTTALSAGRRLSWGVAGCALLLPPGLPVTGGWSSLFGLVMLALLNVRQLRTCKAESPRKTL